MKESAEAEAQQRTDEQDDTIKAPSKEVDTAPLAFPDIPADLQALPNDVAVTRLSAAASEDMVRDDS